MVGPIIAGALFFLADAPPRSPGVYAETPAGIYHLTAFSESVADDVDSAGLWFPGIERRAPILPGDLVYSFFVARPTPDSAAGLDSFELLFIALDYHTGRQVEHAWLPFHIRDVTPDVSRVTSPELEEHALHGRYTQAITRATGLRGTVETYVGLVIPAASGNGRRIYPVRVGPFAPLPRFRGSARLLPTWRP